MEWLEDELVSFWDFAYEFRCCQLLGFEGGGSCSSRHPPPVLCFHTHFPCSHHVGCAHWAAGRSRRSTGARGTGAGGRQTAGRRAGHWRESWAGFFSFPREAGGISSHFKLALYIIPIYLGSGWRNWSNMYNVCTEISIPWVAESTTFFRSFQISDIWHVGSFGVATHKCQAGYLSTQTSRTGTEKFNFQKYQQHLPMRHHIPMKLFSTVIYLLGSGSTKSGQDIDLEKGCVLQNLTCNEVSATSFIPISLVISKKNYSAKPKNPVLDFPKMNNWFKSISGS